MDRRRRFALLSEAAIGDREHGLPRVGHPVPFGNRPINSVGITGVRVPGRGTTTLMRVMQTNACSLSCGYCPTFCGGKVQRATLSPEETATTFMEAHRKGLADGLFLTSGVPGRAVRATDRMLATIELLRRREDFRGYIHVKLLPGADDAQVETAARLANRVSVNLEGPGDAYVRALAREKDFSGDLLPKLERVGRLFLAARRERAPDHAVPAGATTQFVVGAAGERDREILDVVARLEREQLLHHAHFSAFQPVAGTPMEGLRPTPARRELRLYQAEHLLRQYGFRYDELAFEADGNLALDFDPKTSWALAHPERFPLEVTTAPYAALVRVPGVGPLAARTLVTQRRRAALRALFDLERLGVDTVRAGWYLTLRGRRLADAPAGQQLRLFPHGEHLTQAPYRTAVPPCAFR
ncbi:MAG TPA: radical SAM protein [Methylomirabilota bacterium]|jgi:predicted DNA-binding helix-hairpin-helix protein|nr:radical SAM protein [Methylomirabilota bacterium]